MRFRTHRNEGFVPRIRDALRAGTKRNDLKIFQAFEGNVRLVEEVSPLRGSKGEIGREIDWDNEERLSQSLGLLSPKHYRLKQAARVA